MNLRDLAVYALERAALKLVEIPDIKLEAYHQRRVHVAGPWDGETWLIEVGFLPGIGWAHAWVATIACRVTELPDSLRAHAPGSPPARYRRFWRDPRPWSARAWHFRLGPGAYRIEFEITRTDGECERLNVPLRLQPLTAVGAP